MKKVTARKLLRLKLLASLVSLSVALPGQPFAADDLQFNMDVLDVNDRKNVDLTQFSHAGFIMPGAYTMTVHINKTDLPEIPVTFMTDKQNSKASVACLTPALVKQFGLKEKVEAALRWQSQGGCLDTSSLQGLQVRGDLATSSLYISIPQAWLEYSNDDWDPPSRWDNGIPGLLLDYNTNIQQQKTRHNGSQFNLSSNGTLGANLGAWRVRADWQGRVDHQSGANARTQRSFDWSRYYAYRALTSIRARLTVGEDYLQSNIFDNFRFTGASLNSDDNMLPPNLRGYAPEVTGIARTNARVIVSQQGRVLYESQVAAGPFRIQDLSDAVTGQLDVKVEEQDGTVQTFIVNTASIPYLTRPGTVRYKMAAGKPSDWKHRTNGPMFGAGEFTWGVSNGWSLYGGGVTGGKYNALSMGVGRDLLLLGAISFDASQSWARFSSGQKALTGSSYRVSYSKNFDEYDSQITFAGYRFSQENYMSMSDYLDVKSGLERHGKGKQMYTMTLNKQFRDLGLSTYFTYTHQTYWDRPANDRYNLMLSRYFDLWNLRSVSVSLSAYRNRYNQRNDDGMYLSLSVPWGNSASLGYNMNLAGKDNSENLTWSDRINRNDNYSLSAGGARHGARMSGYYNHDGDIAHLSANASYNQGEYTALGLNAQGGLTLTPKGAALHRSNISGGTRLLVDTDGVANVPVQGYGGNVHTNWFGKAVIADVSSYYRNSARIDLDQLGDNAEALTSVVQATLTEGAIGYRQFNVISGAKAMATIKLPDGSSPPFGATVLNARRQDVGLVNDGGSVYLSGVKAGEAMQVRWDGKTQCEVRMPDPLPKEMIGQMLLLPCHASAAAVDTRLAGSLSNPTD